MLPGSTRHSFSANVSPMPQISGTSAGDLRPGCAGCGHAGVFRGRPLDKHHRQALEPESGTDIMWPSGRPPPPTHPLTTQLRLLQTACWFSYLHLMQYNIPTFPNVPSQEGKGHKAERRTAPEARPACHRLDSIPQAPPAPAVSLHPRGRAVAQKDPRDPGRRAIPAKVRIL